MSVELPGGEFNVVVRGRRGKYRIAGQVLSQDAFTVIAIDETYTHRWAGNFSANFIDDITQKAGCVKRINVFWRMLLSAALGESQTVTLQVLTDDEINSNSDDGRIFIVITQQSEFDRFRYPLPLKVARFTYEEYEQTIQLLYEDNKNLKKALANSDSADQIAALEAQVGQYKQKVEDVRRHKDAKIAALKKKMQKLKAKLAKAEKYHPVFVKS